MWTIIFFTSWQCSSFVMGNDDWLSHLSDESQLKCVKRPPKSLKNEMLVFGLRSISDDQLGSSVVSVIGSSVVSVWVFSMPPPNGKAGIRVTEKFRFFRFTFNKFPPKDNSVQSLHHLLAMQLIFDWQCTNWFTLHFYNL